LILQSVIAVSAPGAGGRANATAKGKSAPGQKRKALQDINPNTERQLRSKQVVHVMRTNLAMDLTEHFSEQSGFLIV
jgi:hypothetical protein